VTTPQSQRPKVGLLALTLDLYETLSPRLRPGREAWVRRAVLPALEDTAQVMFEGACFTRDQVEAQIAEFEQRDADALLVMLLSYSPSQIALPALRATRLPILVWNTQELAAITSEFSGADKLHNHGVHGTQDLANVLLRSGTPFEYATSHLGDEDATAALADFFHAAAAVKLLRRTRIGLLGYPFPGMGDFALDTTEFAATLGCAWTILPMEEFVTRAADASREEVAALVQDYRASYTVAEDVTEDDLDLTARAEAALRGMARERGLGALTYQFMAFGEDERAPTLPFVAISRMMAEGVGFGGEGDLIAAAGTAFLNRLNPPASFSEIFTIDFGGNALFLSHMGEANVGMARRDRKPLLAAQPQPIVPARAQQLCIVTCFEPGPATFFALTLGPEHRWRIIASPVTIADRGPVEGMAVPHALIEPREDVRTFLTAYAKAGGPHHNGVCFGDARGRLRAAARLLGAEYVEV